jgi:hypothetical protein
LSLELISIDERVLNTRKLAEVEEVLERPYGCAMCGMGTFQSLIDFRVVTEQVLSVLGVPLLDLDQLRGLRDEGESHAVSKIRAFPP